MSGSSRSRLKHKLEPISLDELAGTTGMSGFGTLFTRDLSQAVPLLDKLSDVESAKLVEMESGAPGSVAVEPSALDSTASDSTALDLTALVSKAATGVAELEEGALLAAQPVSSAPETTAPPIGALETGAPESSAPKAPAPETHAPITRTTIAQHLPPSASETGALLSSALVSSGHRRPRIREALSMQDAHSLAEQAVYEAMYDAGQFFHGQNRILTIGLRTLAELSRMAYSNCKANVRSLIEKLAIDANEDFSFTDGRRYIIYGAGEVVKRRRAAGLTHVVRTRGVVFVDPILGLPLTGRPVPKIPSASQTSAPDLSVIA